MTDRLARLVESIAAAVFLAIVAGVVTLVIMRYVFNTGVVGSDEAVRIMFVYTTALGAAVAAWRGDHIAITAAIDLLSPRRRRIANILALALAAVINAVMVWQSLDWIAKSGAYLMPALQLPQAIKQVCVPIGCGAAVLFCLARIARLARRRDE